MDLMEYNRLFQGKGGIIVKLCMMQMCSMSMCRPAFTLS